jgi:serine/threonine-protein kinase
VSLTAGTRIGVYEITALIGTGGMGEVYRATDATLKRQVALKILPSSVAVEPGRLSRFRREAELLASLNHPNIAQIYGFEEGPLEGGPFDGNVVSGYSGTFHALVMELVEGETLADRIAKGPLRLDEALSIAKQVADALDAAHEQGIVHRDLKPANIKVRSDDTVKVLDFGLAKAMDRSGPGADVSQLSTVVSATATQAGVVLGTAAYMSPEQARGQAVDKRTDIWAFGCVLYEMLTGRRVSQGETVSDTLAAVLKDEPDWARVPPSARRLLGRCLQRDPKHRLRDIGDAWQLLEDSAPPSGKRATNVRTVRFALVAAVLTLVAAVGWWRATHSADGSSASIAHLDVDLGPTVSLASGAGASVILSPAGDRLAYVSESRLVTRRLDEPTPVVLPGTEGAAAPFFSPDGQWIAFFAQDHLKKVSVRGGTPIEICAATSNARGGSWGDDDQIVAAFGSNGISLSRVAASGGTPVPLTTLDRARGEVTHRWPQVLPGSRAVLFTAHTAVNGFDDATIDVYSLVDGTRHTIHRGGMYGRYVSSSDGNGYLLYVNKGTLFAERFDLSRMQSIGPPVPAVEGVTYAPGFGSAEFDVARNGTLVYRSDREGAAGLVTVQWLDRTGRAEPFVATPGDYLYPSVSPDGSRVVFGSGGSLVVYDHTRDTTQRLTGAEGYQYPLWTPDGRYIVFRGKEGVFWMRADGASESRLLIQSTVSEYPWSFTADGSRLAIQELDVAHGSDYNVLTVPVTEDAQGLRAGPRVPFLHSPAREGHPAISPDGRWIAYFSDASGTRQIFVRAFPDNGSQWQVSNAGGVYPTWSRDGRELLYRTEDNRVMVVPFTVSDGAFVADKPRPWAETRLANVGQWRNFDAAPDGRIVALMPAGENERHHIVFVSNFLEQLRRAAVP